WVNQNTLASLPFSTGDRVTFGETGSHSPAVNIKSVLSPSSVEVDTDFQDYTFTGYGWLSGATALVKNGEGTLTISPLIVTVTATMSGTNILTSLSSTANLTVGMPVSGDGISSSTSLTGINSGASSVTISKKTTKSQTTSVSFTPFNNLS